MTSETLEREAELDELFDDAFGFLIENADDEARPLAYDALIERLQRDEDRTLAFISRRIQALLARRGPLDRQRDAMLEHYNAQVRPLLAQMEYLSDVVSETLLAHRQRNPEVKTLTLLGVGEWKSRKVGDGWDIKEDETLPRLDEAERARFVEDRPHLLTKELRAHLDALLAPAKAGLTPDMPEEEQAERLRAITDALAAQYGVGYRPERISVRSPIE